MTPEQEKLLERAVLALESIAEALGDEDGRGSLTTAVFDILGKLEDYDGRSVGVVLGELETRR